MVRVVKKAVERREEIIAAAGELFLVRGYDRTTMKEVMDRLQIAKGTIYHYFTSKEELLEAVLDSFVAYHMEEIRAIADQGQGDALARLKHLITESAAIDSHDQEVLDHLHQPGNTGMHLRLLAKLIVVQAPLYAELIDQGRREKLFTTEHPLESAEFILAGIQFLTDMGIYPWTEEQLSRRALALPALIEAQLGAPPGSFAFVLELLASRSAAPGKSTPGHQPEQGKTR